MKATHVLYISTLAVLALFSGFTVYTVIAGNFEQSLTTETQNDQTSPTTISIRFTESLPLDEVIFQCQELKLQPYLFQAEFIIGSTVITDFLPIYDNSSLDGVYDSFLEQRQAYFLDLKQYLENTAPPEEKAGLQPNLNELQSALNGVDFSWQEVSIRAITLETDEARLERVQSFWINQGEISVKPDSQEEFRLRNMLPEIPNTVAINSETWVPEAGTTTTGVTNSVCRYILQTMYWDNKSGFGLTNGYEHEFRVENGDHRSYFSEAYDNWPNCHPRLAYNSTTFPPSAYPYLDTRFNGITCTWDNLEFTAGIANANVIGANIWYNTYMRVANGNSANDRFSLQGGWTYRSPTSCYTEWCTFHTASVPIVTIIPYWTSGVPGSRSWAW